MCCVTEITLKMETEMMAAKALELMKDVLSQADGLELLVKEFPSNDMTKLLNAIIRIFSPLG